MPREKKKKVREIKKQWNSNPNFVVMKVQRKDLEKLISLQIHRTEPRWSILERVLEEYDYYRNQSGRNINGGHRRAERTRAKN